MNRQILRLAIPFIISNITVPLLGTVDTALMGHLGSTSHLGAIGLSSSIFNFLYWNFAFLRMSMAGMAAQAYGADNKPELSVLLQRSCLLALAGALILIGFQIPIGRLAFWIVKGEPDVEQYALQYFSIRIYAAPATLVLYAIVGWFIGMQNARAPMWIAIIVNGVNIACSAFFVMGLGMKSEGVAWGTLIAQYSGLVTAMYILWKKYREYLQRVPWSRLFQGSSFSRFFKINRDVFIRTFFVILVLTYYNFASAGDGSLILGVNVIFLQLLYTFSFFIDGFANAAEALVGRYVGERNPDRLRSTVRNLFLWGGGLGLGFTLAYGFGFDRLIRIFSHDAELLALAAQYSGWIMWLPLVACAAFVWDGIYLGATATREYRNATLVAAALFFALYYLFRGSCGNHALLMGQMVFFGMRGIVQTIYYKTAILGILK